MPIFMKAGSIEGDVVADSHRNWVEVDTCSFELSFAEEDVRKSLGEGAPSPILGPFEVEKSTQDRAGPGLMQWMVDGDELETVQIDVCGDTIWEGNWRCHVRYILKSVVLTDYTVNMSDAEKGELSISMKLKYDELSIEHMTYDKGSALRTGSQPVVYRRPE